MKTGLVILLLLDVFKSTKTEFRHHQQERYGKEINYTSRPWSSSTASAFSSVAGGDGGGGDGPPSTIFKFYRESRVPEMEDSTFGQHWTVTVTDDYSSDPSSSKSNGYFFKTTKNFLDSSTRFQSTPTKFDAALDANDGDEEKRMKNQSELSFSIWKSHLNENGGKVNVFNLKKPKSTTQLKEISSLRISSLKRESPKEMSVVDMIDTIRSSSSSYNNNNNDNDNNSIRETSTSSRPSEENFNGGKGNFLHRNSFPMEKFSRGENYKSISGKENDFEPGFPESVSGSAETKEMENCVEEVIRDFSVSDDAVALEVLTDRNELEMLANMLAKNTEDVNKIMDVMEYIMNKYPRISLLSVNLPNEREHESQVSRTIYRKGDDELLISSELVAEKRLDLPAKEKSTWTYVFRNCLTNSWNFGYYFPVENDSSGIDATVYFSTDYIIGTVDHCNPSFSQILNGGPKCDAATTKCLSLPNSGFRIGGYKCLCREGFHFPQEPLEEDFYFSGSHIERMFLANNSSLFKCSPCLDSCPEICGSHGFCLFQGSNLLRNSILFVQVFCVLTTSALTILVFKHRKCKTIAVGMWTIMEVILLGSIILYGTIIIRAFNPSTILCLIEPWCREIGFVLCYGAIILKLYRILIEFRTRKAHRWVVRDKDLLKYLLGMVIVVFGYMAAWTATNLDLIRKENFSMLTTGVTVEGVHYKTCKAAWWDYVTETGEILILVFGIHLSYASRNATTQFQERCFLCLSISTEAIVSGIFYVVRYFYWETAMHPDTSFVANFIRCQLTTTVVLLLLLAPKWWYHKVQINKGRVSRNYLMQESGRGPFEAFKPQDGITATSSDVEGEFSLADMNPEDIRAELKRLYTQLEVLKNKTIRYENPHISKRRGGRKIAHRRFSLQTLRQQTHRLSTRHADVEITEAEASRTPEDSVCSNEGPSIVINDAPNSDATPRKNQK